MPDTAASIARLIRKTRPSPYEEYVERLASNPLAKSVKKADLTDNMDFKRIPEPTEKDFARLQRPASPNPLGLEYDWMPPGSSSPPWPQRVRSSEAANRAVSCEAGTSHNGPERGNLTGILSRFAP